MFMKNEIMTFYNEKEQLYLETDASGVGLGASPLQARDGMWFSTVANTIHKQSLTSAETHYSNIEREVLNIQHGLGKFHHHCFACKVSVIIDHKLLVTKLKKDAASISDRLQRIQLCIHQYKTSILYKQGPSVHCTLSIQVQPQNK